MQIVKIKKILDILTVLLIAIYTSVCFVIMKWGGVDGILTVEQIIWHIKTPVSGIEQYYSVFLYLLGLILLLTIAYLSVSRLFFGFIERKEFRVKRICIILHSLFVLAIYGNAILYIENHFAIRDFIEGSFQNNGMEKEDFIADNYFVPENVSHEYRHNLVVIMVESLEQNYKDCATIHNLNEMQINNKNLYTPNLQRLNLTGWTISAMVGWHFGLPLKLPKGLSHNSYEVDNFLPNAKSIFDILADSGYKNVLLLGSDSNFSGMRGLFKTHGSFDIKDKSFYDRYYSPNEYSSVSGWGYNDEFIFQRAKEELFNLKSSNRPYVLFVQTIDTHGRPSSPADEQTYSNSDRIIKDFFDFVKENADNTSIAIVGDHTSWDKLDYTDNPHRIYNLFIPVDSTLKINNKYYSALDVAPTLLEMTGASWENRKFGMGVSMFGSEESLITSLGVEELNRCLSKKSMFYDKLF